MGRLIKNGQETVTRDVRIMTSKEQWTGFDAWAARQGYQSLPEAFRALIISVNKNSDNQQIQEHSQLASGVG